MGAAMGAELQPQAGAGADLTTRAGERRGRLDVSSDVVGCECGGTGEGGWDLPTIFRPSPSSYIGATI